MLKIQWPAINVLQVILKNITYGTLLSGQYPTYDIKKGSYNGKCQKHEHVDYENTPHSLANDNCNVEDGWKPFPKCYLEGKCFIAGR